VEVHPCPERALSDGAQSLDLAGFETLMRAITQPLPRIAQHAC
jgi:3-deoxy-7-phosphoheptulonate synthase